MISVDNHSIDILKAIATCHSHDEFIQIGQPQIVFCLKEYFPMLIGDIKNNINFKDPAFYFAFKKLAESYRNFITALQNNTKNDEVSIIGAQFKQKTENPDLQGRKNTRATLAMRNSKNQQELKKDQIFVRLIPRSHNCIHFMVKNHNFPRIQCRLSCNQHLQYLITYLTNKWLRGKVGVGHQIKLYPDPSTYMQKHSNEGKRPSIIHEPLNNYLMFTDIMAAFGVAQNGCINLMYDITELRKEKQKYHKIIEKDNEMSEQNYNIKVQKPEVSALEQFKQFTSSPAKKQSKLKADPKNEGKSDMKLNIPDPQQDQLSIGAPKDKRSYKGNNSLDYSDVNSLGYQFNAFNSNQFLGALFNMNNSNTFLNLYSENNKNNTDNNPINTTPTKNQNKPTATKINPAKISTDSNNVNSMNANLSNNFTNNLNSANTPINAENKLENIRNFISIIEKQVGPSRNEAGIQLTEKQQNSMHKSESNFKKQVKTVTIIKKKNQPE